MRRRSVVSRREPEIYQATQMFGTILENVVLNQKTRRVDYADGSITEIRALRTYPLHPQCCSAQPWRTSENIVFLTADAFGVLPPISRLTPQQAMCHFLWIHSQGSGHVSGRDRAYSNV